MVDFMENEENVVATVAKDDIVAEDIQVAKDVAEQPTKQVKTMVTFPYQHILRDGSH